MVGGCGGGVGPGGSCGSVVALLEAGARFEPPAGQAAPARASIGLTYIPTSEYRPETRPNIGPGTCDLGTGSSTLGLLARFALEMVPSPSCLILQFF